MGNLRHPPRWHVPAWQKVIGHALADITRDLQTCSLKAGEQVLRIRRPLPLEVSDSADAICETAASE
jgi:hypothetical protein